MALDSGPVVTVKARGIFRHKKMAPLVGDIVETSEDGWLTDIYERRNEMVRPACANIDEIVMVFAVHEPEMHLRLLDRFLIEADRQHIPSAIIFNKADLIRQEDKVEETAEAYRKAGYKVFLTCAGGETPDLEQVRREFAGKLVVLAGPSGVGKSSLINALIGADQEVGNISRKIARGKNTTRQVRLLKTPDDAFIADTPGFTAFYEYGVPSAELDQYYPEFAPYLGKCYYQDCHHVSEPGCAVHEAAGNGQVAKSRYLSYCELYEEIRQYEKDHPDYGNKEEESHE